MSEEELQILLAENTLEDGDEDYDFDADLEPYLEEVNRAQEALTVASQKLGPRLDYVTETPKRKR